MRKSHIKLAGNFTKDIADIGLSMSFTELLDFFKEAHSVKSLHLAKAF